MMFYCWNDNLQQISKCFFSVHIKWYIILVTLSFQNGGYFQDKWQKWYLPLLDVIEMSFSFRSSSHWQRKVFTEHFPLHFGNLYVTLGKFDFSDNRTISNWLHIIYSSHIQFSFKPEWRTRFLCLRELAWNYILVKKSSSCHRVRISWWSDSST